MLMLVLRIWHIRVRTVQINHEDSRKPCTATSGTIYNTVFMNVQAHIRVVNNNDQRRVEQQTWIVRLPISAQRVQINI